MKIIAANFDVFLYEFAVLLLCFTLVYVAVAMKKLTGIIGKDKTIWLLPLAGAFLVVFSLVSHAFASFSLFPSLDAQIKLISSEEVLLNKERLESVKTAITEIKTQIIALRSFSFLCFFVSSFLLVFTTGTYIKWISK